MIPYITTRWSQLTKKIPTTILWVLIWVSAWVVPFLSAATVALLAECAWLSALALAPFRYSGPRLVKLAIIFLIIWSTLMGLLHLSDPAASLRPALNLAAWLPLGLNLILSRTPLEIALTIGRLLVPILGLLKAQKLALALALLTRLIPRFLSSAIAINTIVKHRTVGLPLTKKLPLLARAIIRDVFSQNEDLSRTLIKRWPWTRS